MSALSVPASSPLQVLSARAVRVEGLGATRYRLRRDHPYTGDADLDLAFSTFDALVIPPADGREGAAAVTLLNGITKPLAHSIPAALELARGGAGAILIDTPLGGVRRPGGGGNPGAAVAEIARRGVALDVPLVARMFDGVAADLAAAFALGADAHGIGARGRRALFGASFGCLLSSFAFGRDGLGDRLIGAIGHPGLPGMARGLVDTFAQFSGIPAAVVTGGLRLGPLAETAARRMGGEPAVGALRFARLLSRLGRGGRALDGLDPLGFASGESRPVAFLAGERDPVATPEAIRDAASAYPRSTVEVLPALGHGWYPGARPADAPTFGEACGAFALRQVRDWT
ncbi:alpha/beta fold hydrolase [Rubricoccus marinus]|uniref:alpha/beta fold hydrolase n=1 Tax=Rubricoccus marinus TaxID=716817 RepID=UPI00117B13FA|nr:hypothetical protein [Rubricoccus marinus]